MCLLGCVYYICLVLCKRKSCEIEYIINYDVVFKLGLSLKKIELIKLSYLKWFLNIMVLGYMIIFVF